MANDSIYYEDGNGSFACILIEGVMGGCERMTEGERNGRAGLLRYTTDVRSTWERTRGGAPLCLLNHRITSVWKARQPRSTSHVHAQLFIFIPGLFLKATIFSVMEILKMW